MRQSDLIRTIQSLEVENQNLRMQATQNTAINFQQKYMKALRQISAIMNANKKFKQELMKLRQQKDMESSINSRIQKEEFNKVYENFLIEKNQFYAEKDALELQNQKLKYTVASLQENIADLKNDKINLQQEKESIRMMSPKSERDRRSMDYYEEHQSSLNKVIRKLQDEKRQLQNKLYELESDYTNKINQQEIEMRETRSSLKEHYEEELDLLRKEISKLKVKNNELSIKVQGYSHEERQNQGANQYENKLINTLREVRAQMEPMRHQIAELNQKNQYDKEQSERDKANLEIKVMQYQAEITRLKEIQKLDGAKHIRDSQRNRKAEEVERTIKKLEQENRMLGGRLIVLQSKQITLRNRNSDDLEQRVLEFQTRVEMLLNDKQTVANMKNVGIHQLIALKAYILELDAKIKQLVQENQYSVKKYKTYKEKYSLSIKQLKQHDIAINSLKAKVQGYDRLVVKLQGQFERSIAISETEIKTLNKSITEQSAISIEVYKKRYESLLQKLTLQQKYSEQELETQKLNYETKIVELNIKLEEINSIKETISLYKIKNQQLAAKLTERQNQLLEVRINKSPSVDILHPRIQNPNKQAIQKLNETITSKESIISGLENKVRKIQSQWKSKYQQLEQMTSSTISKKTNLEKEKQNEVDQLEQQINNYRSKISELELKIFKLENNGNENKSQADYRQADYRQGDYRQYQQLANKNSELEIDIEQLRNKYESELSKGKKLSKNVGDLKKVNQQLQTQLTRIKYQQKNMEKQIQLQLSEKDNEIKKLKMQNNEVFVPKVNNVDTAKISQLTMQIEILNGKLTTSNQQRVRYSNMARQLEIHNAQINRQIERLRNQLETQRNRAVAEIKNSKQLEIENLEYNLKIVKQKLKGYEDRQLQFEQDINRMKKQWIRQKSNLKQDLESKEEEYDRLLRELNKFRNQYNTTNDNLMGVQNQYEMKISRMSIEMKGMRDQLEDKTEGLEKQESENRKLRQKLGQLQRGQLQLNGRVQQLDSMLTRERNRLTLQLESKENQYNEVFRELAKLKSDLTLQTDGYLSEKNDNQFKLTRLNNEVDQLKDQINSYEHQLNTYQAQIRQYKQRESTHLSTQDQLILKIQSLQNQLKKQNHKFTQNLEDKDQDYNKMTRQLNSYSGEIEGLRHQLSNNQQQISRYEVQIRRYKQTVSEFEARESDLNMRLEQLQGILNNERNRLIDELQKKQSEYRNINREYTNLRNQINSQQSNYKQQLDQTQERLMKYMKQSNQYIIKENQWKNKITELEILLEKTRQNNKMSLDNFVDENQDLKNKVVRLEHQIGYYREREAEYERGFNDRESYTTRLSDKINQLEQKQGELEKITYEKDSEIFKLNSQLKNIRHDAQIARNSIETKESYISKLNEEFVKIRNQMSELSEEKMNKQSTIMRLTSEIGSIRHTVTNLQQQLEEAHRTTSKWKYQQTLNSEEVNIIKIQLQEKDGLISRLQSDIRSKTDYINQLSDEIQSKTVKMNQLQGESVRFRAASSQYENQLLDRNAQISRLNIELNTQKSRYSELEEQIQKRDNQWQNLNRQLIAVKTNIEEYQQDIVIKNSQVQRYKKDIKQLNQAIESLNQEIFEKTKQINHLNQQIFRMKLEGDQKSTSDIFRLESEISQLKSRISMLENEVENKELELNRAETEIRGLKRNYQSNTYSDEDYDILQAQYFQLQNSYNTVNRNMGEKDIEIQQLNNKIEQMKKYERDLKRQVQEEKQFLQGEIQNILKRERKLKVEYQTLQNQYTYNETAKQDNERKQFGISLYSKEVDRLNTIVEEMTEEINGLKLKLTNFTNQQDRIVQNLTVMTLTFAEVQSLRQRMLMKQNEISEVRKSLINYASSHSDISLNSNKLLLGQGESNESKHFLSENASKEEEVESNQQQKWAQLSKNIHEQQQSAFEVSYSKQKQEFSEVKVNYQTNNLNPNGIQANLHLKSSGHEQEFVNKEEDLKQDILQVNNENEQEPVPQHMENSGIVNSASESSYQFKVINRTPIINHHEQVSQEQYGTIALQQTQPNMSIQRTNQINVRFNSHSLNSSLNMERSGHSISNSSTTNLTHSQNKTIHIEPTYGHQRNMVLQAPPSQPQQGRSFVTFNTGQQQHQNFYVR